MRLHRLMSTRNIKALVLFLVVTARLSLMPISSDATVDWNEGFEYANDAAFGVVWSYSCLGNPSISSERAFSGSKSVKQIFRGVAGHDPGAGGCFMDRPFSLTETLWTRYYIYFQNFLPDPNVSTKLTAMGSTGYPSFWWNVTSSFQSIVAVQGIIKNDGSLDSITLYGGFFPKNQWACVESRITMSAPGVDNGIVQQWINGNMGMNFSNVRMRAATLNQNNSPTGKVGVIRIYVQHGRGVLYIDDYAVSRDARIGCSGSATISSDTYPPAPPRALSIQ